MSEDVFDITVRVMGRDDRFTRVTLLPSDLSDQELGKVVRQTIRRLVMATTTKEEALLDG